MCGVFAYVERGGPPDPELLREVARLAARRGPHGHGWWTSKGVHRASGPLDAAKVPVDSSILGHARMATMGARDVRGLQPVVVDGHVLAHNGNVYNWRELDADAPTDSWAIGDRYATLRDLLAPLPAMLRLVGEMRMKSCALLVRDSVGFWMTFRRSLPLHVRRETEGTYVSSVPFSGSIELPDDVVVALS